MAEAPAGCSGRRPFAAACGVLSRRVRAEAAERMPAAAQYSRSAQAAVSSASSSTMLLMPGADLAPDLGEEPADPATPAGEDTLAQAQLTIVYGGRVLVFDGVAADRAAKLMRVAAQDAPCGGLAADMMPVARKASLQRFMEKRRGSRRR